MQRRLLSRPAAAAAFVLVLALVAACGPISVPTGGSLKPGTPLGDMTLTGLDGQPVQFKPLVEGKVALVDLWATWCAPCIQAMPHLQALHNQYKDRGFTVVGIMVDDNATKVGPEFLKDHQVSYPIVMDDAATNVEKQVGPVQAIPMLVLIDREGKVLEVFRGFGGPEALEKAVEKAFSQQASAQPGA